MGFYCNECNKNISEKVFNYSRSKFNRPLCMNCQSDESKGSSAISELGKFTQAIANGTAKVHDKGGMPLVLVWAGILSLVIGIALPIIFSTQFHWAYVIWYIGSVLLIILGIWLYREEKMAQVKVIHKDSVDSQSRKENK